MRFCGNCGAAVEATFCVNCGFESPASGGQKPSLTITPVKPSRPGLAFVLALCCWFVGVPLADIAFHLDTLVGGIPFIGAYVSAFAISLIGGFPTGLLWGQIYFRFARMEARHGASSCAFFCWAAWPSALTVAVLAHRPFTFNVNGDGGIIPDWASSLIYFVFLMIGFYSGYKVVMQQICSHKWEAKIDDDGTLINVCQVCHDTREPLGSVA